MPPAVETEFCKLVAGRTDVDLVRLMLEIATDAYPTLDQVGCLMELDRLGEACRTAVAKIPCAQPSERLRTISHLLFHVEGFHGNREAYYQPENSYVNQVLERRTGLPITLGIIYLAVAARVGLRMFGTNTPGHFMLGCQTHCTPLYVDPFNHGDVLDRPACDQRIAKMVGPDLVLADEHFRPATVVEITARVLRNLKTAYGKREAWTPLLPVQRRLVQLLPCQPEERRDLGLVALRAGYPCEALKSLEAYSHLCGGEPDVDTQVSLRIARKLVAELN